MAFVDAAGLSQPVSTAFARGTALITSYGLAECEAIPEGAGSMIHSGHGISDVVVTSLGHLVTTVAVISAAPISATKIRITFDRAMLNDSKLRSVANYDFPPTGPTGAPLTVLSVVPEGVTEPSYVDVTTTEMTDGEGYTAQVQETTGPTDPEGVPIGVGAGSIAYTGVGVDPTIDSVAATGVNGVEVKFSEAMDDNVAIRDAARYTFDNGLNVLSVSDVDNDTVTLVTDDQIPGLLYTLTVTQP